MIFSTRSPTHPVRFVLRKLQNPLKRVTAPILAKLLVDLIYPFTEEHDHRHVSVQYAPRYRLAFSLLNEDAADGDHIIDWDIQGALASELIIPNSSTSHVGGH